ncbi:NADP-dependent oxidoreductase [Streptomyces sp. NPDC001820]|uniref:NADP-dependent oxidoreductase n=1 Tax=Streptomyces sp. NPDC001820 TaxID=3364613 RepID=UPI00368E415E
MTTQTSLTVQQTARPTGFPTATDFAFVEAPVPAPGPGTALVENVYWSVDPYHREMMDGDFELNAPLEGRTLGRVVASRDPGLSEGDLVLHRQGWRTHALVTLGPNGTRKLRPHEGVPLSAYLSILGGTGLTAYVALTRTLQLSPGDDLFVSAAAGGVGTAVGRIARLLDAGRIVGSAGSAAKVAHLTAQLGFDAAFDYNDGSVRELLAKAAPSGIDTYVDNVGGDHLEAAIASLREHGRIAWVGAIGHYNTGEPPAAPRNLFEVVSKSIRLEGVLVRNHTDVQGEFEEFLVPHLQSGRVAPDVTVVEGFERIVDAFIGMLRGANLGKILVRSAG